MDLPKNQRRKGRSEAGRMERRTVSVHSDDMGGPPVQRMSLFLTSCRVVVPKKMSKKRKLTDGSRKLVQPIPLDSCGRPVFPIILGGLTVYSLGEVGVRLHSQRSSRCATSVTHRVCLCSDHHRQDVVPRRVCHLPSGLLQHSCVCQHEKPGPAVPLHLPNQGRGCRSTGTPLPNMMKLFFRVGGHTCVLPPV